MTWTLAPHFRHLEGYTRGVNELWLSQFCRPNHIADFRPRTVPFRVNECSRQHAQRAGIASARPFFNGVGMEPVQPLSVTPLEVFELHCNSLSTILQLYSLLREDTCCRNRDGSLVPQKTQVWHSEDFPPLTHVQCLPAPVRVQKGSPRRLKLAHGCTAGHTAGHPVCLWHRQGRQTAGHNHHQREQQLSSGTVLLLSGKAGRRHELFRLLQNV